ncbi:hypothetical protein DSL64_21765 [Dyadobacter luteus]|uniref:DUF3575 domain-containing protein n=1 Tax=Dyadobacter luteus TaxID=2259619 RepID=A0A3D8Y743_9BACT|nr:hypothetical protein [Dyadobacter luteus]REA58016.1 hypothetical protein DSL64_21765 [Dyadobacter luteus]
MVRTILVLLVFVSFFSCRALKDSPKYKLTDGIYITRNAGKKVTVYVENTEDSVLVYSLPSGKQTKPGSAKLMKPKMIFPRAGVDEEIASSKYRKNTFDLDVLTIPFKFRPSTSTLNTQLSNHLNGALYLGYRSDTYELSYKSNPIGKVNQRITHFGFSAGLATGIGSTPLNPWVTDDNITDEYDGFVWSKAVCILMGVEKLNFGLALGIDHLMDSNRQFWIYQGKPYLGLTVGLNIN